MPAVGRRKPLKSNVKLTLMSCKVFLETGKLAVQYLDGTMGAGEVSYRLSPSCLAQRDHRQGEMVKKES